MKRMLSIIMMITVVSTCFLLPITQAGAANTNVYGDVNGDGKTSMKDLLDIQKYIAFIKSFTASQIKAADVDNNGAVNMKDVLAIQKYIAKVSPEKPTAPAAEKIYYTKTGTKYHNENPCGNGTYYETTLQEALRMGLKPCEKCVLK